MGCGASQPQASQPAAKRVRATTRGPGAHRCSRRAPCRAARARGDGRRHPSRSSRLRARLYPARVAHPLTERHARVGRASRRQRPRRRRRRPRALHRRRCRQGTQARTRASHAPMPSGPPSAEAPHRRPASRRRQLPRRHPAVSTPRLLCASSPHTRGLPARETARSRPSSSFEAWTRLRTSSQVLQRRRVTRLWMTCSERELALIQEARMRAI